MIVGSKASMVIAKVSRARRGVAGGCRSDCVSLVLHVEPLARVRWEEELALRVNRS